MTKWTLPITNINPINLHYRSNIKTWIIKHTDGKVNINDSAVFKNFERFFSGLQKKLKSAGKGDTTHKPEIPAESQRAFNILLGQLARVLDARGCDNYEEELQKLPEECQNNYNDLLEKGVMYIIVMYDCRRGLEGLVEMTRDFFTKEWDPNTEMFRYEKKRGESSKNHDKDSEDISNSGVILFCTDEYGFNPGTLMEYYLSKLCPTNESLFQRHRKPSKAFSLHDAKSSR